MKNHILVLRLMQIDPFDAMSATGRIQQQSQMSIIRELETKTTRITPRSDDLVQVFHASTEALLQALAGSLQFPAGSSLEVFDLEASSTLPTATGIEGSHSDPCPSLRVEGPPTQAKQQ